MAIGFADLEIGAQDGQRHLDQFGMLEEFGRRAFQAAQEVQKVFSWQVEAVVLRLASVMLGRARTGDHQGLRCRRGATPQGAGHFKGQQGAHAVPIEQVGCRWGVLPRQCVGNAVRQRVHHRGQIGARCFSIAQRPSGQGGQLQAHGRIKHLAQRAQRVD